MEQGAGDPDFPKENERVEMNTEPLLHIYYSYFEQILLWGWREGPLWDSRSLQT